MITATAQSNPLFDRYGPWAVVTGASDGIGRAFARQLSSAGFKLVLVARRAERLEQLARELPTRSWVVPADFARPEEVEAVTRATQALEVGLLVAAAGFGSSGPFLQEDLHQELEMVQVNCRAVLALTHHFAQRFAGQRRGGIVLMSSLLAFQGVPGSANYAATKAYIQTLAEGLQQELAPLGVDVLASAPGPVHSGFAARADMRLGAAVRPQVVARGTLRALGRRGTVRPGWLSVALEAALAPLPRPARVAALARVMAGLTRHQDRRDGEGPMHLKT